MKIAEASIRKDFFIARSKIIKERLMSDCLSFEKSNKSDSVSRSMEELKEVENSIRELEVSIKSTMAQISISGNSLLYLSEKKNSLKRLHDVLENLENRISNSVPTTKEPVFYNLDLDNLRNTIDNLKKSESELDTILNSLFWLIDVLPDKGQEEP